MTHPTDKELDALDAKLASQIGDDVAVIFNHEYLFKQSRIAIADLRAKLDVAVGALEELSRDPRADSAVLPDGWAYYSDAVNYARATLAKIKGADRE